MALPKYSKNPEDWFINCSNPICEEKIIYTNRSSYTQAAKKINDGQPIKCRSCAASGYKHTDEAKEKMSNRVYSEEARKKNGERTRERYANMTEEERKEVSEIQSRANRKYWDSLTEEERVEAGRRMAERMNNISEEKKALKAQKISEAKIDPNGMNHNPETWKVNCTSCEAEIKFEKYHQFQNAKSGIKKGNKKLCPDCKVKNLKVIKTDNPEDWVKKCCDCDNVLKYSTFESYRKKINIDTRCPDCNKVHLKTIIPKSREYSRNPEDWKIKCGTTSCDNIITYTTLGSYQGAMKRLKDDNPAICMSCVSKRRSILNDESVKQREEKQRLHDIQTEIKAQFANFDEHDRKVLKREFEITHWKQWVGLKHSDRNNIFNNLILFKNLLLSYYKEIKNDAISKRASERILNVDSNAKVKPYFNLRSISFIETELNNRFNTKFIHALTESGEYRIYDSELKKIYFADAYCPKLNLWIEIDEKNKFKGGFLKEIHQIRHERICQILNCTIIRFKEITTTNSEQYIEFNPKEQIK